MSNSPVTIGNAWTNLDGAVRIFRHMWNGMIRASERNAPRVHPTQKPIALMEWCVKQSGEGETQRQTRLFA